MHLMGEKDYWTRIVSARAGWFNLKLSELWTYRYLIFVFVKRDFATAYNQTILGPLWFLIQPVFSTIVYTAIFSSIAKIPTDGIPPALFYMASITAWNYFSDCLTKTSSTFTSNSGIFGKVYFPRMLVPISLVISNLIKFGIQFLLLLGFLAFYVARGANVHPNGWVLITPLLLIIMAGLGLGFGIIISSLTTKYRDLQFMLGFGVQLLMYATPVVYPLSFLDGNLRKIALLNPLTSVIETFKYAYLGGGEMNFFYLGFSFCVMLVLLFLGLIIFNKVERNFMDTV